MNEATKRPENEDESVLSSTIEGATSCVTEAADILVGLLAIAAIQTLLGVSLLHELWED